MSASKFNQDISNWNVNKVRDMSQMFTSSIFNQNIGNWIVNNVTNMNNMFGGATSFNGDIKYWNVASVTSMQNMFNGASSFNQNLGNWIAHMRSDVILTDIFTNAQAMITRFGDQILTISHSNWETVFTEP